MSLQFITVGLELIMLPFQRRHLSSELIKTGLLIRKILLLLLQFLIVPPYPLLACADGGLYFHLPFKLLLQALVLLAHGRKRLPLLLRLPYLLLDGFQFLVPLFLAFFELPHFHLHGHKPFNGALKIFPLLLQREDLLPHGFLFLALRLQALQRILLFRQILLKSLLVGLKHGHSTGKIRRVLILLGHTADAAPKIQHHGKHKKHQHYKRQQGYHPAHDGYGYTYRHNRRSLSLFLSRLMLRWSLVVFGDALPLAGHGRRNGFPCLHGLAETLRNSTRRSIERPARLIE